MATRSYFIYVGGPVAGVDETHGYEKTGAQEAEKRFEGKSVFNSRRCVHFLPHGKNPQAVFSSRNAC